MDRNINTGEQAPPTGRLFSALPPPPIPLPGVPLLARPVPAGFPSPADDYTEGRIDLNQHLIGNPEATFMVRVDGDSMLRFGIHHGDTLVVDRSLEPAQLAVVIAVVDGEFTIKQMCRVPEGILLRAGNPAHRDILVGPEQQFSVWGVVRWSLHPVA